MGTSNTVVDQNATSNNNAVTSNDVDIKTSNETYRVYVKLDDKGKIIDKETKMSSAGKDNSAWDKLSKEPGYTLALEQTLKSYRAGTWAGAALIITDEDERVNIFNRGLLQKFGQKATGLLTELNDDETNLKFDPIAGAYDMIDLLNEETKRRNLSPTDKAAAAVRVAVTALFPSLTGDALEERIMAMLSQMQA